MATHVWIFYPIIGILIVSVICCFIRMVIGPTLSDRVIALDLTAYQLIAIIAVYSVLSAQSVYIDVVIALALIIFLGTVAFAQYIEWQRHREIKRRRK